MIKIYRYNDKVCTGNGIAALTHAKDVCIKREMNTYSVLSFSLPYGDQKWKFIEPDNIAVIDGQRYRIQPISGNKITAFHVYADAGFSFVEYMPNMMGGDYTPREIVVEIFKPAKDFHVMTDSEVKALGMEWIDIPCDFFEVSKLSVMGTLETFIQNLEKHKIHAELYYDNYNVALVRQIGKDRNTVVDLARNAKEINIIRDTTQRITRLYPYGKDDLHIGSVNGGLHYIDTPNEEYSYEKYPREGYILFDEIEDPELLKAEAEKLFRDDNPDRIDAPKLSAECDYLERRIDEIQFGDIVTVYDRRTGDRLKQHVTSVELYPDERHKNKFTVGTPPRTDAELVYMVITDTLKNQNKMNELGDLKTSKVEFMKKNTDVTVENNSKFQKIAQYETGAMFVSPNGKYAVAIIDGKIKIGVADSSKADGWNWIGVFGHGEGDAATQTYLYTNLITIMSESGELKIENNLIQMFDSEGTLRFNAGYSESLGKYVFELYNADGKRTAYIDDNGNLTICGIFKTGEDGEARTVIDGNGIQSYDEQNRMHGLVSNPGGRLSDLILYYNGSEGLKFYNTVDGYDLYCYGKKVVRFFMNGDAKFANGASGVFSTANGKKVTVTNGLITDISAIETGE